jgi:thiol-disulfide isomerase/thioredoxin
MRRMIAAGPPSKRPPQLRFAWAFARKFDPRGSALRFRWFCTVAVALLLALPAGLAAAEEKLSLGEFIPQTPPQPAPAVGFTDLAGHAASLDDFRGKPAIVNLWATWCQPCLKEMPSLERLQARFLAKLTVAAISEDHGGKQTVAPFVAKLKLGDLKIYLDPKSDVAHAFQARGLPTSIVVDASGQVVGKVEGAADWGSDKMVGVITPLLTPGMPAPTHASSSSAKPPAG